MGVEDDRARTLKKAELVAFVAECAGERQWAPSALAWDRVAAIEADDEDDPAEADAAAQIAA